MSKEKTAEENENSNKGTKIMPRKDLHTKTLKAMLLLQVEVIPLPHAKLPQLTVNLVWPTRHPAYSQIWARETVRDYQIQIFDVLSNLFNFV